MRPMLPGVIVVVVVVAACNEKPAKDPVNESGSGAPTTSAPSSGPVKCGSATCPSGQTCCNPSCGICTPPGGSCIEIACVPDGGTSSSPGGTKCGSATCPSGQTCCNPSCGICTPPGGSCIEIACVSDGGSSSPPAGGAKCGTTTCPSGQTCCNASCGICTPPGGMCIQMACVPDGGAGDGGKAPPAQVGAKCKGDADCALHSSYCADAPCMCLAIGKGAPAPACKKGDRPVNCLVDPCQSKLAKCQAGACTAAAK